MVVPRIDRLLDTIADPELSAEGFIRGPLRNTLKQIPGSRIGVVIRLLIAEGPKHPDLVGYYWEQVVSRVLGGLSSIIERGIAAGEFRKTAVADQPHLLAAPVLFATLFKLVFSQQTLDTDRLIDTHIDMILSYMKV